MQTDSKNIAAPPIIVSRSSNYAQHISYNIIARLLQKKILISYPRNHGRDQHHTPHLKSLSVLVEYRGVWQTAVLWFGLVDKHFDTTVKVGTYQHVAAAALLALLDERIRRMSDGDLREKKKKKSFLNLNCVLVALHA